MRKLRNKCELVFDGEPKPSLAVKAATEVLEPRRNTQHQWFGRH
eukprot:SAG22_NODE_15107_length_357_cov_0.585271_1_plen_43_part_10